jgi:hypothetical protein
MKRLNTIIIVALIMLSACKKEKAAVANADFRVVNAAVGVWVKVNPGRKTTFAKETQISFASNRLYLLERISLPFKVVNAADTLSKFYDETVSLNSGIYSMFIVGQLPTIETIVKEESDFPFINFLDRIPVKADSVVNVRFLNLSPNSTPVKIKISTATGNEIDNLPFKTIGSWRKYTAIAASTVYTFQVRDAATDALLASFNLTANATNRFKNVSLIIKGLQGTTTGVNAFGVIAINHF